MLVRPQDIVSAAKGHPSQKLLYETKTFSHSGWLYKPRGERSPGGRYPASERRWRPQRERRESTREGNGQQAERDDHDFDDHHSQAERTKGHGQAMLFEAIYSGTTGIIMQVFYPRGK